MKEKEGPIWDDIVTPIGINYSSSQTKPTMHCRYRTRENIKKKLFDVERKLDSIGEYDEENEKEQKEELIKTQQNYVEVEKELDRFYQEELELVKAGEDPLLTCPHCFFLFASYHSLTNHKHQCKHKLEEEEALYVPHYRVLEGHARDQFLLTIDRLSLYRKINICVSTRTACKGIFPLIFPSRGDTSGSHLAELGLMGPEARTTLRRALLDGGELYLPDRLVLDLPKGGGQIYLPPSLLTPTASQRQGDIIVERPPEWIKVSLPEDVEEESEDEDEDEDDGFTSDSSDEDEDEEDEGFWGQVGGGPAGGGGGQTSPGRPGGGRTPAGRRGGRRTGAPTREDQQVKSSFQWQSCS